MSGDKAEIKVGGSYRTCTVTFYDNQNNIVDHRNGHWDYSIVDETGDRILVDPLSGLISFDEIANNKVKIKFNGGSEYLNQTLVVTYISDDEESIKSSYQLKIVGI